MTLTKNIGDRIKELRKRSGLSLDELASRAEMSKSGIWEIESGSSDPRLSTLRKIASALGVPLYQMLTNKDFDTGISGQEMRVLQAMRHMPRETVQ